jgi:hypothetical protein
MPPEIVALIDKPLSLIAVLFVGAVIGMAIEQFVAKQRRAAWQRRRGGRGKTFQPRHDALPARAPDAADQLRIVMHAEFKAQRLLNKSEARLFRAIDKMVLEMRARAGR